MNPVVNRKSGKRSEKLPLPRSRKGNERPNQATAVDKKRWEGGQVGICPKPESLSRLRQSRKKGSQRRGLSPDKSSISREENIMIKAVNRSIHLTWACARNPEF
jgi:hypothetical protein